MDHKVLQARSELLRRMGAGDFERLRPHLKSVFLELRSPLENEGQKIEAVYFLESGIASGEWHRIGCGQGFGDGGSRGGNNRL
ncbi:hypothetical protein [Mesorhizobium salmacidum]|uniref:hypothetical protein n=1 Tax=Mesorhizobium salmacidum TaxID=3015171 RepID=UPI0039F5A3F5